MGDPGLVLFTSREDAELYPRRKRERTWSLTHVPYQVVSTFPETSKVGSRALQHMVERGWDASSGVAPVVVASGPSPQVREATISEQGAMSAIQFVFASVFSNPELHVDPNVVGDLFAARLRIRMPESPIVSSVDLSIPLKALDRIRAAAGEAPPLN